MPQAAAQIFLVLFAEFVQQVVAQISRRPSLGNPNNEIVQQLAGLS